MVFGTDAEAGSAQNDASRNVSTLELAHIVKTFPGVRAVSDVSLEVRSGEVLAIVGENGAGKSTLIRVAAGLYSLHSHGGTVRLDGEPLSLRNVNDAEAAGIVLIPQEVQVVPALTVAENIFLNREPGVVVRRREMRERATEILRQFGMDLDPSRSMGSLRVAEQQMAMLARALVRRARFVLFDEPTASFSGPEVAVFFDMVRRLTARGVGCVFVSHRIDEVFTIADRIAVMRNGELVKVFKTGDTSPRQVVSLMVGRDIGEVYARHQPPLGDPVLELGHITASKPGDATRQVVSDVSLDVRAGEIVGLFGLLGAGRTELASAVFGAWLGHRSGTVKVRGRPVSIGSPRDAIRAGIALLTEDRRRLGLFSNLDVLDNVNIGSFEAVSRWQVIDGRQASSRTSSYSRQLRIKAANWRTLVMNLSGGNQQKVLLARLLAMEPSVVILDEPTRGIDVGAKAEVYSLLNELTKTGLGVLLISSEVHEVSAMSDRVLVLYKGRVSARFDTGKVDERMMLEAATGGGMDSEQVGEQ